MPRWITVRQAFDYHWPDRSALTAFSEADCGDHFVKDELADFAVEKGYATEGKVDGSSRSTKVRKRAKPAKAAKPGTEPSVDHADAAGTDRPADRPAVDSDA
jgi:hypothetical protein